MKKSQILLAYIDTISSVAFNSDVISTLIKHIEVLPNVFDKTTHLIDLGQNKSFYSYNLVKNKYLNNYKMYTNNTINDFDYYISSVKCMDRFIFCTNEDLVIEFKLKNVDFPDLKIFTWENLMKMI